MRSSLLQLATVLGALLILPITADAQVLDPEQAEEQGVEVPSAEAPSALAPAARASDVARGNLLLDAENVLLIPNTNGRRIGLFEHDTGDLTLDTYVHYDPVFQGVPIAITPNFSDDGFYISVQAGASGNVVYEYDDEGDFVGIFAPAGGADLGIMQNIRGIRYTPDGQHLAVTVAGAGPNQNSVIRFDSDGLFAGHVIPPGAGGLNSPWDILFRDNDILVGASMSSGVHRYDLNGTFLDMFATNINFPQQIIEAANGNVLVVNSSPAATRGVYEFEPDGTLVHHHVLGFTSPRGVHELDNGNLLVSSSSGVHEIDRATGNVVSTKFEDGLHRFINVVPAGVVTLPNGVMTIAEARAAGVGATVTVEGTVSRAMGAFTYFQDDTAGLTIRQTSGDYFDDVAAGTITTGTTIQVTGTLSAFGDLLQINDGDLEEYTVTGQGEAPAPQVVTLDDIVGDSHQAELVYISEMSFPTASGTFSAATTYDVTDASITPDVFDFRIPNASDTEVNGTAIPDDLFDFTGVVGHFFDGPQLLAILESDIQVLDTPPCEIEPNPMVFGEVMITEEATIEATVSNDGTTACVLLEAQIDEADFSTDFQGPVTVEPGGSAPFNVTFAPTATGQIEGTLTLSGEGDIEVTASLTGLGIAPPEAAIDPEELFFMLEPDATASVAVTLSNEAAQGAADLDFSVTITETGVVLIPAASAGGIAAGIGARGAPGGAGLEGTGAGQPAQSAARGAVEAMLAVEPMAGTIIAGSSEELTVTVDTDGVDEGTYELEIHIATNDPENPTLVVAVEIVVEIVGTGGGSEPVVFALEQNYPNPFARQTTIEYAIAEAGRVTVEVYDMAGRRVATLVDADQEIGYYTTTWDASDVAAGVYFYRIQAGAFSHTIRALVVR